MTFVLALMLVVASQVAPGPKSPADLEKASATQLVSLAAEYAKSNQPDLVRKVLVKLDALGDTAIDQQFDARRALQRQYRGRDQAAFITQATWLVEASSRVPSELRSKHGRAVVQAYMDLAEAVAGQGRYEHAVELLKKMQTAWPDMAAPAEGLLTRYLMVGTDAPPITAERWVKETGTSPLKLTGKVTMVQFTAHWCGPCKFSYPAMRRLSERYAKDGLQTVFFTQLYGYFGTLKHLTPEEELGWSRKYYADLGIKFPIAIGPSDVEASYRVGGLPQINLVDRNGKIRAVMVGYGPEMEKRLAAQIEALLAEPARQLEYRPR